MAMGRLATAMEWDGLCLWGGLVHGHGVLKMANFKQ